MATCTVDGINFSETSGERKRKGSGIDHQMKIRKICKHIDPSGRGAYKHLKRNKARLEKIKKRVKAYIKKNNWLLGKEANRPDESVTMGGYSGPNNGHASLKKENKNMTCAVYKPTFLCMAVIETPATIYQDHGRRANAFKGSQDREEKPVSGMSGIRIHSETGDDSDTTERGLFTEPQSSTKI